MGSRDSRQQRHSRESEAAEEPWQVKRTRCVPSSILGKLLTSVGASSAGSSQVVALGPNCPQKDEK